MNQSFILKIAAVIFEPSKIKRARASIILIFHCFKHVCRAKIHISKSGIGKKCVEIPSTDGNIPPISSHFCAVIVAIKYLIIICLLKNSAKNKHGIWLKPKTRANPRGKALRVILGYMKKILNYD